MEHPRNPPARAPADDQSASWHPALRPDSAGAPAHPSAPTESSLASSAEFHSDSMDSRDKMDDDERQADSPPPRTSEDRHPLNDGPEFVFDEDEDDEFSAWQHGAEAADFDTDDLGARTPLADERSATPQPPAQLAADAASSHVSEPEPASIHTEHPSALPDDDSAATPVAESAESAPAPAEEPAPTPNVEHDQPDIETIDTEALHETNPAPETPEEHPQEQHYEHQGETTTLEEAVQESAAVPLANDTDSPDLDWAASEGTFDLGAQQPEPAPEPQPSHTEEQVQLEHDSTQAPELAGSGGLDWGASDSTFDLGGEQPAAATQAQPVQSQTSQMAAEVKPIEPAQPVEIAQPVETAQPVEATPTAEAVPIAEPTQANAAVNLDWGDVADDDFNIGESSGPIPEIRAEEVKTEEPAQPAEQSAAPDLDWGGAEDDFGFGAVAQTSEAPQAAEKSVEQAPQSEEKDLSAMWAEALADDDLLEGSSVDPSAFFLDDDDEGFLDDTTTSTAQNGTAQANGTATTTAASTGPSASKYAPAVTQAPSAAPKNPYAPQSIQTTNVAQPPVAPAQVSPYGAYGQYQQPAPPQRPQPSSAQSFVDKAKGGYSSPFDLPEDLAKTAPRKRVVHAPSAPPAQQRVPPPRTSSMYSNPSSPALPPPPHSAGTGGMPSPASTTSPQVGSFAGQPPVKTPSLSSKPSTGDFFEDLPVVQKPRPSGRYTPQIKGPTPPPPTSGPLTSGPPSRQGSQTYAPAIVPPPVGAQPERPPFQASQSYAPAAQPQRPPIQTSQSYAPQAQPQRPPSQNYAPPAMPQLQQPEMLNPFPDMAQAQQKPATSTAPPALSRYSPAPPSAAAPATSRYSPAPPSATSAPSSRYSPAPPPPGPAAAQNRYSAEPAGPPRQPVMPFAPRTSSPLAFHSTPDQAPQRPPSSGSRRASLQPSVASVEDLAGGHSRSSLELVREIPEQEPKPATPPPPRSIPSSTVTSPNKRPTASYTPQYQSLVSPPGSTAGMPPPRRSQSQSPGATMKGPKLSMAPIDRPASVNGLTSPTSAAPPYAPVAASPMAPQNGTPAAIPTQRRRRTFSRDLSYVKPTDETVNDPLERWKGAPIFNWGIGGTVMTTFPKEIPRYGTGTVLPQVKCTPGEIKIQKAKDLCPLWDPIAKFPGPLKTKSKKKEAISWLKESIETMEKDYQSKVFNGELPSETRIRFEEKILLWKVLEVFVEHEGHLEGSDAINEAVKKILSNGQDNEPQLTSPVDVMGSSNTTGSVNAAEPIDPQSVSQLRSHLIRGDREKAVWEAADKRLWGHALLIASTMNKDIWKQVVQEFVRQEVRKVSGNNQSLAALYEVFAGNWEESIDELVPASARAGFQMVSKTDRSGANTNVFEGLDRWRETLLLIVNNRSEGDPQALLALGKLLAGYGRVEAAHVCYLFARSIIILGGPDDPSAHVVLLGADHLSQRSELGRDMEPILLTEIFEFAVSLSSPTAMPAIPHLQAYKLAHAFTLSEYGYKTEAQAYCDAITTAMKSTTRLSPYYNASLVQELDDLTKRLSEAPSSSSSWISKPTMGKVSSSVWSSFNKFVAGDDSDADSTGPGGNETSPFAKISGDAPTVSRSPSTADLYGSYPGATPSMAPSSATGSRYAPAAAAAGPYAPRTSGEQARSRYDPQTQSPYLQTRPSMESNGRPDLPMGALFTQQDTSSSPYNPSHAQPPKAQNPYAPVSRPMSSESSPNPLGSPYTPSGGGPMSGYQPTAMNAIGEKSVNSYQPPANFGPPLSSYEPPSSSYEPTSSSHEPPKSSYDPPASSYEPPTSGYEPPSYQPYEPEPAAEEEKSDEEEKKPKKKAFMDDDDDDELERRAAALKAQQKAEADRQADEAFRKAAEADANKPAAPKKTSSWLGGWFKKSDTDLSASPNKPIRAKLGEENSFYYDPDLKKWVNKKAGGADAVKPAATPPPPRGGPSLRNSASMASLAGPPPSVKGLATPPPPAAQRSTSMPPPMAGAGAGGPPPAGTGASTPGSGAGTPARGGSPAPPAGPPSVAGTPGGGPPAGPPSRPATSMSNASSIDDLLGVPAPRKGGAPKKKGRAGRYVDVMAK